MKILMVCLGNICRSPIAEGVLQSKMDQHQIKGQVDSAGVIGFHAGEAPDKRAVAIAGKHRIDISGQRARQFKKSDFKEFDLILTMDHSVHNEIRNMATNESDDNKVQLFMEQTSAKGHSGEVPDPYYGGPEGFENVFRMINNCCDDIITRLKQH